TPAVISDRALALPGSDHAPSFPASELSASDCALALPAVDPGEEATLVRPSDRASAEDEATIVRPRKPAEPTFSISLRRANSEADASVSSVVSFYKDQITIGRGSRQVAVDLKLEGDLEISRQHATLSRKADGSFEISCSGANPILLSDGREVASGDSALVKPGEKISVCSYELAVQG